MKTQLKKRERNEESIRVAGAIWGEIQAQGYLSISTALSKRFA